MRTRHRTSRLATKQPERAAPKSCARPASIPPVRAGGGKIVITIIINIVQILVTHINICIYIYIYINVYNPAGVPLARGAEGEALKICAMPRSASRRLYIYTYVYVWVYIYIYIYICVYIHTCIHICIYIYSHYHNICLQILSRDC